jgi:hypothetical protein
MKLSGHVLHISVVIYTYHVFTYTILLFHTRALGYEHATLSYGHIVGVGF